MTIPTDRDASWRAVHDPATEAAELAAIAAAHPEFAEAIAEHPNAYEGLREWARGAAAAFVDVREEVGDADSRGLLETSAAPAAEAEAQAQARVGAAAETHAGTESDADHPSYTWPGEARDDDAPATRPSPWWRRRAVLATAAGLLVVGVVASVIGISAAVKAAELERIQAEFDMSAEWIVSSADALAAAAEEAEGLLASTPPDQVADPDTIAGLRALVDQAALADATVPDRGASAELLRSQITELDGRRSDMDLSATGLVAAMDLVRSSVHDRVLQQVTANATYSIEAVDGNGNAERITLAIGSWVRGDDSALLDEAWASVGGLGTMPLLAGTDGFTAADGAFAFGTVSIENTTPDFPAENFANGNAWVYLTPLIEFDGFFTDWHDPSFEGLGATMQARQYTSGASTDAVSGLNPLIRADMSTSDRWGPVPIVIGLDTVFSPNFPEGNPKLDAIHFTLRPAALLDATGDTSFQIGRSW
ncbi:hypothetical protein [Agromyces sp. PvR057]|uniref:variant leucine-rich repeat-containing protein n=1 Tax=Agromyces sp. PvR057 TaxID=3156403 RepID=UPI003394BF31